MKVRCSDLVERKGGRRRRGDREMEEFKVER